MEFRLATSNLSISEVENDFCDVRISFPLCQILERGQGAKLGQERLSFSGEHEKERRESNRGGQIQSWKLQ